MENNQPCERRSLDLKTCEENGSIAAPVLANLEKRCPVWGSEQFHGRLSWRKQLPDELSTDDLFAIAEMLMPEADRETVMLLAGHALRSKGYVAAMESAVSRARFYAAQEGRNAEFEDVDRIVLLIRT